MKKTLLISLLMSCSVAALAQAPAQVDTSALPAWKPEALSEVSANFIYFFPSQQWSGFYDNMYGFEAQYRYWLSKPFGLAVAGGVMNANVRKDNPNLIDPAEGTFTDSATMIPLGVSGLVNVFDKYDWRLNLEAGIRYVFINSDIRLNYSDGTSEGVDMENAVVGVFMLDLDRKLTDEFALFAGAGVQVDISPGEMSTASMDLFDNNLKGYSLRLGAKYSF
ncbi:MAG TPA: hypothetical protein DCZ95_04895 [Verrucomicrobia bacterium]|nr:MAG: hypothetical protein A2X46_08445 [Lentisphaerae bacterium GWF2_57_35]HBA83414.1 hypothetical protein [Verrucomicrobiota bacterium]